MKIEVNRFKYLILSLMFYTAVGLLFIVPSITIRIIVFFIVLYLIGKMAFKPIAWIVLAIVGATFGYFDEQYSILYASIAWITTAGAMIGITIGYEKVFKGVDYSSVSALFSKEKKYNISTAGYYIFKIIPELKELFPKIFEASLVYNSRSSKGFFSLFIQGLAIYMIESLSMFFKYERLLWYRRYLVANVASKKRLILLKYVLLMNITILLVGTSFFVDIDFYIYQFLK